MIKDLIRLKWHAQLSHAQIAETLKLSKGVVAKYVALATAAGLDWNAVHNWSEQQLATALQPRTVSSQSIVVPDWARVHRELDRKGVTLMLLWQEYVQAHPTARTWRYTQFCEHYKAFAATLKRSMRQHRRAGEKLFIDFAGPTVPLRDGARAQVFVSAMAASSYVFACATPAQRLDDWIDCMVRALHFYGGVPQLVVPDNARAVIALPDRYEPRANETVHDFARHYGTSVLPARPLTPRDKASAESSVQVVTRWVLARLRHHRFDTVAQVDAAIMELLPSVNERAFQKLPGSRASVFAELDAPALMPLPAQRYELARFKTVKVHIDYHVEIDGHRYSVPHALVGQVLQARMTRHGVELLLRGQRVAAHARNERRGGFTTVQLHMPAAHRAHLEWTPQRLIEWGQRIGMACGELVTRLLQTFKHPEHGYRSCLGLLSLSRRYGDARLEAACERALALGTPRYRHVRDLLANNRDRSRRRHHHHRMDQSGAHQPARTGLLPMTATPSMNAPPSATSAAPTMLNNVTLAQLRALKLQGFADALQQQTEQADCLGLSFDERLALLVEREVYARGDRKRTRLLQRAQLKYPTATLEDASFDGVRGIDRSALMGLALSSWIERGETISFAGATGLGKTWLACALAQYACRQGHSALYLRVPRLAEELRILHGAGSFRRWLQALAKIDVLVLDDWGTGAIDAATRADLLEIIDDRSAQRATVIAHQLPIEHWHAWLGDPTVADAILDRLMQHCRRFHLEGESRRTGQAVRAAGKPQKPNKEVQS